ncbi:MAG TPA: hypothetical protein VE422_34010 [Terriglobia bacterium]|nr:hypothetical protein [Terriglobia bacterium]
MSAILYHGLELFVGCLLIHILVWRHYRIRNGGIQLGVIFLILPPVVMFGAFLLGSLLGVKQLQEMEWLAWGLSYLLHFSLSGAYMAMYTALISFSPSIAILEKVEAHMPRGLKRHELSLQWFTDDQLSGLRRKNLLAGGLISTSNDMLVLGAKGRVIALSLSLFRRFVGLSDLANG